MFLQGNFQFVFGPITGWIRDTTQSYVAFVLSIQFFMAVCVVPWIIEIIWIRLQSKKKICIHANEWNGINRLNFGKSPGIAKLNNLFKHEWWNLYHLINMIYTISSNNKSYAYNDQRKMITHSKITNMWMNDIVKFPWYFDETEILLHFDTYH